MKFDIILANPPFNIGEKMLTKWFDIANEICTVQPSTWLLGKKQKKDIVKNVDAWEKTEIEGIQGSEHFDAAISGTIAIQHFIKGVENNSHYDKQERITFDGKFYKECGEITNFSNDELLVEFENIVKPLYLKDNLRKHITGVPGSHYTSIYEYHPNPYWYVLKMMQIRGNKDKKTGKPKNDFYTLITNNKSAEKNNKGLYKDLIINAKEPLLYYYHFYTKTELDNFINYLKTYFVRGLLYMFKNSVDITITPIVNIPWFDFSDPIFSKSPTEIDNALFKKYNISDKIRKHIEEILPDYYSIRKDRN